jgi:osmoprotectant transport system substrate-binding protein
MMKTRTSRPVRAGAAIAAASLLLAACGGGDEEETELSEGAEDGSEAAGEGLAAEYDLDGLDVTVASKDFAEMLILGQIAAQALEEAGASVELVENLPSPDGPRNALLAGEADVAWEYTGTAWINYLGNDDAIADPMEQYEAVRDDDLEENGVVWAPPAPFDDTYGFAYQADAADDLGNVETISELAEFVEENPDDATLCVDATFASRDDGLPLIEEVYDFEWPREQLTESDFGVIYTSVADRDPCNFAEIFTTDGRITALDLYVIEDDQNAFISYLSSVMMMEELAEENPELLDLFEAIGAPIDEELMTEMNAAVDVDGEFPEDVAADYLESQGFLG